MNISEPFIRRPVMTTLVMLSIFLVGLFSYFKLPISALPDIDFPTITVTANLPGANPNTMATTVATPLEKALSNIAGITSMTSSSNLGSTQITLQFELNRNIDSAAQDVQSAIASATRNLPTTMPSPPTYKKVNPADAPVLYIALSSKILSLSEVDKYAESILAQRISMVPGVAQVNIYGSQKYAVRIQLHPDLLAARNISLMTVADAIHDNNLNLATGALNGAQQSFNIDNVNGQLPNAQAFRPLIITYQKGAPLRLEQLGEILDDVQNNKVATWYNHSRAVVLAIQRQPGTNTLAVIHAIQKLLPTFKAQLPAAMSLDIAYDRSASIRASVREVQFTLLTAAFLVIAVIMLFLKRFSATLIPALAIPLSLVGTFSVMGWLNFSLDNISLLALTLVVGYVVDDAIVMLENITRHLEMGKSTLEAALDGAKEISFTIVSMTLSLVAVLIPILFMGGLVGRLFHEFAISTCVAILFSGFISLTLTPMLCSRLLKSPLPSSRIHHSALEFWFQSLLQAYEKSLNWAFKHHRIILLTFLGSLLLSGVLLVLIPKGFVPNEDTGQLMGMTEADPDISFAEMIKRQQTIAFMIEKNPEVSGVVSSIGTGGSSNTVNTGRLLIRLKPFRERKHSSDEIIQILRKKVAGIPGINLYLQNIPSIPVGGRLSKSTYQYTLQSNNLEELYFWTQRFQQALSKIPQLQDVTNDLQSVAPQIDIHLHRDEAMRVGITPKILQTVLGYAYGSQQISTIYTPLDDYQVILELAPQYQKSAEAIRQLYLPTAFGNAIPLETVASLKMGALPLNINHQMQFPASTLSFNLKPGVSLSEAVRLIEFVQKNFHPPLTLSTAFQGTAKAFQSSQGGMGLLLIAAIITIYVILGILYESFIHPLTILSGLPAAAVGAFFALILFNKELDLYAFIGIIMLIGIVKKNAIMMIDFAIEAKEKQKKSSIEAIHQACIIRFRPIMMTTMAAILGALPIALSLGEGSASRRPLGIVVVGGLLISQLLTLYITPIIYLSLDTWRQKNSKI